MRSDVAGLTAGYQMQQAGPSCDGRTQANWQLTRALCKRRVLDLESCSTALAFTTMLKRGHFPVARKGFHQLQQRCLRIDLLQFHLQPVDAGQRGVAVQRLLQ